MITGTGISNSGGARKGIKKDIAAREAIKKRQKKRRDIEDIDNFMATINSMLITSKT